MFRFQKSGGVLCFSWIHLTRFYLLLVLSVLCSTNRPGKCGWCELRGGERVASIAKERSWKVKLWQWQALVALVIEEAAKKQTREMLESFVRLICDFVVFRFRVVEATSQQVIFSFEFLFFFFLMIKNKYYKSVVVETFKTMSTRLLTFRE